MQCVTSIIPGFHYYDLIELTEDDTENNPFSTIRKTVSFKIGQHVYEKDITDFFSQFSALNSDICQSDGNLRIRIKPKYLHNNKSEIKSLFDTHFVCWLNEILEKEKFDGRLFSLKIDDGLGEAMMIYCDQEKYSAIHSYLATEKVEVIP